MITAKELFRGPGLGGVTIKFEILGEEEYSFYLHVAIHEGRPDFIALTLSGLHDHNIRAGMEVICRMATRALRRGAYTLEELCSLWLGYQFEPQGICPQLANYGYEGLMVKSPLDAAAKIMKARFSNEED